VSKRVAIVQSSYIPWKGYFDLMRQVDEFILYDDAQYTRRDWRNRNQIKTKDGLLWLTVPVEVKGRFHQSVKEVTISDRGWADRHFKSIMSTYARAPFFRHYRETLEDLYRRATHPRLSDVNRHFLEGLAPMFGITTPIRWSMDYELPQGRVERLVALCERAGATAYLSGPSARAYMDHGLFVQAGIDVSYIDYQSYAAYPQLYPPFVHQVSAIDLLLSLGPGAAGYLASTPRVIG
jgi:hypothetical protein